MQFNSVENLRLLLYHDFLQIGGKRSRIGTSPNNLAEVLDHLQREISEGNANFSLFSSRVNNHGPIIADVTDEPEVAPVDTSVGVSSNPISSKGTNVMVSQPVRKTSEGMVNQSTRPLEVHPASVLEKEPLYTSASNSFNQPVLTLSPSIDRQLTAEFAEYFTQQEQGIDNCRELLGAQWDLALDDLEDVPEQGDQQLKCVQNSQLMLEGSDPLLALSAPSTPDLLTPNVSPKNNILE